jgi:hypothetical protein
MKPFRLLGEWRGKDSSSGSDNLTPSLLDEVDRIVSSTTSPKGAHDLLRGMVADLLRETNNLREQLTITQQERDVVRNEYQISLIALKHCVEGAGNFCGTYDFEPITGSVLSPEEATHMVIRTLSTKVEQLAEDKSILEQELTRTKEFLYDVEALNESRLYKIDALEAQFQSINGNISQKYVEDRVQATSRRHLTAETSAVPEASVQSRGKAMSIRESKRRAQRLQDIARKSPSAALYGRTARCQKDGSGASLSPLGALNLHSPLDFVKKQPVSAKGSCAPSWNADQNDRPTSIGSKLVKFQHDKC